MYIKQCRKENNLKVLEDCIHLIQVIEAKDLMKSHTDKAMYKSSLFQVFKSSSRLENLLIKFIILIGLRRKVVLSPSWRLTKHYKI